MRFLIAAAVGSIFVAGAFAPSRQSSTAPDVRANPNTRSAGVLRDGALTVTLDAEPALWRFSATHSPMTVPAFAEAGKPPLLPAPLIRVPAGTEVRVTVRNSLASPLTLLVPAAIRGGPDRIDAMDSVVVAPGATGTLTTRADVPGNYVYRGKLPDGVTKVSNIAGALAGAVIVDSATSPRQPRDRVFVIAATEDSASAACDDTTSRNPLSECPGRRFIYTINGEEWPNTARLRATVGDSLHWRVINASYQVHPMHLHGFYFRVDQLAGPLGDAASQPVPGQLVVTQLLSPLASMSMTWSPDRPGNWLFHCHVALHNTPYALIAAPDDPDMHDMAGLVLGTIVSPRRGVVAAGEPAPVRRIRLVAEGDRSMRFVLEDSGRQIDTHRDWSPELDLVRGDPVAITIVNHLAEPTSVHWHGMEVQDSYMDGAAGFSGTGQHLAPMIAPGDSFVARFTPPRAGTFMYHSHLDEEQQELNGLEGALVVHDRGGRAADDHVFFLKGLRGDPAHPLEIDGQANPDTVVLRAGRMARLRLINLAGVNAPAPDFSLTARADSALEIAKDTLLVHWRPLAKDGFDLPEAARVARPARQRVAIGETYDFEYEPTEPGRMQLEVRLNGRTQHLLVRVPIRVEAAPPGR